MCPSKKQNAWIDTEEGVIVGDKLGVEQISTLYKRGRKLIAANVDLGQEMGERLAVLKADFARRPGSYLLPFRNAAADCKELEWLILQFWPSGSPDQRIRFYTPRRPASGMVLQWTDQPPGGVTDVEWIK